MLGIATLGFGLPKHVGTCHEELCIIMLGHAETTHEFGKSEAGNSKNGGKPSHVNTQIDHQEMWGIEFRRYSNMYGTSSSPKTRSKSSWNMSRGGRELDCCTYKCLLEGFFHTWGLGIEEGGRVSLQEPPPSLHIHNPRYLIRVIWLPTQCLPSVKRKE